MRIGDLRQPLGEQLRRGQQVAQVVVDLRHRKAERGEMALLLQHRGEVALHGGELALGRADLVAAVRRRNDARGILRVGAERHHVGGHAPHRPHEQQMQREIDERRGDRRNDQREHEDADREIHHRLAQRRLVEHDLDELAAMGAGPTTRITSLSAQNSVSKASMMARCQDMSRTSMSWSMAGGMSEAASSRRCWPIFIATARAPMLSRICRATVSGHHAVRRGLEHERRGVGGGEPVIEPVQAEIRDRGT